VLLFIMLISGTDVFCGGWTFQSDPCSGHGECYAAAQCHCELGFGPEVSYSGEPLCSRDHSPCTGDQLQRALAAGDNTCCFGHGNITAGERCSCNPGFGPESIVDPSDYQQTDGMRQTLGEPLCARHMACTAGQLTSEWGETLTGWTNSSVPEAEWTLCFSWFTHDWTGPAAFHSQCDPYNATLSVAHNVGGTGDGTKPGNYTYGGFGAGSWNTTACCEDPRNDCGRHIYTDYCWDQTASQDFLFGLWMPGREGGAGPQRFFPTGANTRYQFTGPEQWPEWGSGGADLSTPGFVGYSGDLRMGTCVNAPHQGADNGGLGHDAQCFQGGTYAGSPNEICAPHNWASGYGGTQLEVWRPACTTCGGHGACDASTRVCVCDVGYALANPATCVPAA
jgi:hypothetical protein